VVERLTGGLGQLAKARKIRFVQGRAAFKDAHTLSVETDDGKTESIAFESAMVATGSRPTAIPAFDLDTDRVMDSTDALELADIPDRLLVVGGGYIGLELGSVYAALGSKVSVVEMMPQILPGVDPDLTRILAKRLDRTLDAVWVDTKVKSMEETDDGIKVMLEGDTVEEAEQVFDRVLVSVGRRPNSEDLGLENTGVEVDGGGWIKTDDQRRTAEDHIYAIGDVAGNPMLAHKGTHEGLVAVEAIQGKKTVFEPRAIPAVVFTDPEIAWCGLTEAEAKEQEVEIKVARFPWSASGRATTLERNDGLTKLVVHRESGRVLGVGMAGVNVGDMIAEGVLAVEMGAAVEDLALSIHPHPTLSETVMEAAEAYHNRCTHMAGKG
jgi:dihydrolipoamide dehydrogenase